MKGCRATGVTISGQQVKLARMLTSKEARVAEPIDDGDSFVGLGAGGVRYMELDAESLGVYYNERSEKALFDCVWISEALSHLPNKESILPKCNLFAEVWWQAGDCGLVYGRGFDQDAGGR